MRESGQKYRVPRTCGCLSILSWFLRSVVSYPSIPFSLGYSRHREAAMTRVNLPQTFDRYGRTSPRHTAIYVCVCVCVCVCMYCCTCIYIRCVYVRLGLVLWRLLRRLLLRDHTVYLPLYCSFCLYFFSQPCFRTFYIVYTCSYINIRCHCKCCDKSPSSRLGTLSEFWSRKGAY